ncbi:LysR family transcriptional regulator [Mycolicibacterium palauense]|uniref:LysR family transcriptional regulator n=1 Tax=Mycolicibacterium palauense TaxID=2034511 RepID=UPI000BFEED22|nr:LysR family transcriptional regulator [Mycolicibacterium palauense]
MDTHRLKYFLRIADEGSITRAAHTLGVAQPALSRQIRLLEEDLGITLFRRTPRGVQLTEEGERLRASTAAPLRQLERAVLYAGSAMARVERGLRLGILPTIAPVFAAPMLAGLKAAFPKVGFHLTVANTEGLVEAMLGGAVDIALINAVPDDRLFYRELVSEELVAIGGPDSELRPDRPLRFSELADHPLVIPGTHTGISNTLHNTASRFNVTIHSYLVTDSVEVTREVVAAGLAHAVLPASACADDVEVGRLRYAPVHEPVLTQEVVLATTAQLSLPRQFCVSVGAVIREEAQRLTETGAWAAQFRSPAPWEPLRPKPGSLTSRAGV